MTDVLLQVTVNTTHLQYIPVFSFQNLQNIENNQQASVATTDSGVHVTPLHWVTLRTVVPNNLCRLLSI